MVNFIYIKPENFITKIISSKIKLNDFESKIDSIKEFYTSYHAKTIEANSDIRSLLEKLGFLDFKIYEGEHLNQGRGRFDLAISEDENSRYNVLIELKSPNSLDMIEHKEAGDNLLKKSLYQAIYYYISDKNKNLFNNSSSNVKYLIITNYISWYFIRTSDIEKLNKIQSLPDINNVDTSLAYQKIEIYLRNITQANNLFIDDVEINYTSFNLKKIKDNDEQLSLFLKFLSPQYLLNKMDIVDKNNISKKFYQELFYIIGLQETTKKVLLPIDNDFSFISLIKEKLPSNLSKEEQFEYAMELVIIWINRILFIQLYSSILVKYNIINKPILNSETHYIFDDIDDLFFNILNKKENRPKLKKELNFDKIPYINSSLFQKSDIENKLNITIASLKSNKPVKIFPKTNIKNVPTDSEFIILEYFILFLNSYDIAVDDNFSDNSNNDLINASVLGMVFEKLNGYKDGAFFTPSYITEFMSKSTLETLIIEKFNSHGFIGDSINDIGDNITKKQLINAKEIFNSITICDPAIGSGHYLVSILNTMLLYKAKLGLFDNIDENQLSIVDDMLVINNIDDYNNSMIDKTVHKIYKELYESKQLIIENSLFGVDINPKSVYISRLRLWIELLKHTYFITKKELVLLPNIDINIRQGNSLLSKYLLNENFNSLFKADIFTNYKDLVKEYKNPKNNRIEIQDRIDDVKYKFDDDYENKNKFEWRYEFPEILDNNGKFVGFDLIIGNPPYIRQELIKELKPLLEENYEVYKSTSDLYTYFYELSFNLLKNDGIIALLSSNKFCRADYGYSLRKFLKDKTKIISIVDFEKQKQFKEATTDTLIFITQKRTQQDNDFSVLDHQLNQKYTMKQDELNYSHYSFMNNDSLQLYNKIRSKGTELKDWNVEIKRGILTGLNEAFVINQIKKDIIVSRDKKSSEIIVPVLRGADVNKYKVDFKNEYLMLLLQDTNISDYKEIEKHLELFKENLSPKKSKNQSLGRKKGSYKWFEFQDNTAYIDYFKQEKIIWQELTDKSNFTLDTNGYYTLAGTFIMTGTNLKYILSILNSKLIEWYFHSMANSSGTGTMQWKKTFVERLPIVKIDKKEQNKIISLVDLILSQNSDHNYSGLKQQIDEKVYQMYNLTSEEIELIENWYKDKFLKKKILNKVPKQGKLL